MENLSKNKQKKRELVADLVTKVDKAKAIVLTNYQGLSHKQLETFKKGLHGVDGEFAVTKNTLLKRALEQSNLDTGDETNFDQPTGTLFLYGDIVSPLKALAKLMKEFQKPTVKYGILDKKAITATQVMQLATLPSREVLVAQLLGQMKAPIAGLHRALSWNMQKFVMTLKAIEKTKQPA